MLYDNFCQNIVQCNQYIDWQFETVECRSCAKVGQSYNIDVVPDDCEHLEQILLYKEEMERQLMWQKLSEVKNKQGYVRRGDVWIKDYGDIISIWDDDFP